MKVNGTAVMMVRIAMTQVVDSVAIYARSVLESLFRVYLQVASRLVR
jgi:hypothetical protein